ncbi:MAG TPA: glycoside hydrolase family 13 protein [Kiritimatiellia bacterium]|nr:glycoside hydrolase family 13 protein [Kiritimatiellia bacterium]
MNKKAPRSCFVPDWARDAIWYQIFPERFRNGCPASNPKLEDFTTQPVPGWKIMPWGGDWYAQQAWEKKRGDFFHSVYLRRYGGDLVGVYEKLDYLQELGVTAIYLNPVFHAPSLHKYDGSSFHHVDPAFGPDREGDLAMLAKARETEDPKTWVWTAADRFLLKLIREVHRRGMKIILDGVFNHTGRDFFAFRDLLRNGDRSRYKKWYKIKHWNADGTFDYEGWFGHAALPELARTENDLIPPVRRYIFDITRRWMDPNGDGDPSDGIDGWRLDVAFCVPHGFWKAWRRHVKRINPEAYLTAEIVTLAKDYLRGDEFDAVMNYMWLFPSVSFFSQAKKAMSAAEFRKALDHVRKAYPPEVAYVQQNLYDSHDVGRIASMFNNPELLPIENFEHYFHLSRVKQGGTFRTTKPTRAAMTSLRQAVIFQMTYPGAPMIYYGTEVGLWGANDPCDRQPMLWDDVRHQPETHTPRGKTRARPRAPDKSLFAFYRQAIALRREHAVLRRGTLSWVKHDHPRVLIYERRGEGERIRVALNAADEPVTVAVPFAGANAWTGKACPRGEQVIPPRSWLIIRKQEADA